MGQLHELLAIRQDRRGEANRKINAAMALFKDSPDRFRAVIEKFHPAEEDEEPRVESSKAMAHTVEMVLGEVMDAWVTAIDVEGSIDATNAMGSAARAQVGESSILKEVPAMFLLNLEKDLGQIANLIESIPCLDPTKEWEKEEGTGLWKHVSRKNRTRKEERPIVLYAATKEHPAQTQLVTKDVIIGELERIELSGEITIKDKEKLRKKCAKLVTLVKQARSKANAAEHEKVEWGGDLRAYLFGET